MVAPYYLPFCPQGKLTTINHPGHNHKATNEVLSESLWLPTR